MSLAKQYEEGVSVVVAVEGRVMLLSRLLHSLETDQQDYEGPLETIVVDSSSGAVEQQIRVLCNCSGVRYYRGPEDVKQKRNIGIWAARHSIVLFIDSDCTAPPDLVRQHADTYATYPDIGGVVGVTEFVGYRGSIWDVLDRTNFFGSYSFARVLDYTSWGPTTNLSVRTAILQDVGGFDTRLPFRLGGEDVDLCLRVSSSYLLRCQPKAIVLHDLETMNSWREMIERVWRWGRSHYYLFRKYPNSHRTILPRFPGTAIILGCLASVASIIVFSLIPLIIAAIWLALTWILQVSILRRLSPDEAVPTATELQAEALEFLFELGVLLEGLVHLDVRPFYKETSYSPKIPGSYLASDRKTAQMWSLSITTVSAFFVCFLVRV